MVDDDAVTRQPARLVTSSLIRYRDEFRSTSSSKTVAVAARLVESLIAADRLDEAHIVALQGISTHPRSKKIRSSALDLLRRSAQAEPLRPPRHLALQYGRRFRARHAIDADGLINPLLFEALCVHRAGAMADAGARLEDLSTEPDLLAHCQPLEARVLIEMTLQHHCFALANQVLTDAIARWPDYARLKVVHARYLRMTGHPKQAAAILSETFRSRPDLANERNRLLLARSLSSADRIDEALGVLDDSAGVDANPAALGHERLRLICKGLDVEFSLSVIDPSPLPIRATGRDQMDELLDAASADRSVSEAAALTDGLERNLVTSLASARYVPCSNHVPPPQLLTTPILRTTFGDDSWQRSELGRRLVQQLDEGAQRLDHEFNDYRPLLSDEALNHEHPAVNLAALERLLLWLGGLRLAHRVNQLDWHRRVSAASESDSTPQLKDAIAAAANLGRPDIADGIIQILDTRTDTSRYRLAARRGYVDLTRGDRTRLREIFAATATPVERDLAAFLKGASVAVVAPAPGAATNGVEIDGFDIVIRPNSLGLIADELQWRHGSRTDVVSFAATRARQIDLLPHDAPQRRLAQQVRFALFKYRAVDMVGGAPALGVPRHGLRHLHTFALRQLNHLPQLVFYLSWFDVARIKIFNANLFLSRNPWEADYIPDGRTENVLTQLVFNDSLDLGHSFLRRLWDCGVIEADDQARTVLDLETVNYVDAMSALLCP